MPYSYTCSHCEKSFVSPKKNRKYCSNECSNNGHRKNNPYHTCMQCGKQFYDQKHSDRKYCSSKCVYESQKAGSEERICPICNTIFITSLRHGGRKTCSNECAAKKKGERSHRTSTRIKVNCSNCDKVLTRPPSRVDGRKHFCNQKCHYEYCKMSTSYIIKTCTICNKKYTVLESYDKRRGSTYCSKKCNAEGLSQKHTGENNPNWKGGRYISDYGSNWKRQKKRARQRDKHICQVCGCHEKDVEYFDVHHIVPFATFEEDWKTANKLTNLICLCRYCHSQVECGNIKL